MTATPKKKKKPAAPKPKVFPVHPIFAAYSKNTDPLPALIETIDVKRIGADGQARMIGWVIASEYQDEMQLLEKYGPGDYHLVGRDVTRAHVLRHALVPLGEPPAPAPAPGAAGGEVGAVAMLKVIMQEREAADLRAQREREAADARLEKRLEAERDREASRTQSLVTVLTSFSGGQLESTREMAKAMAARPAGGGGGGGLATVREAMGFITDMEADNLARRELAKELGEAGVETTRRDILETAVESFFANMGPPKGANVQ